MNKILFIDDEPEILSSYKNIFMPQMQNNKLDKLASEIFGESSIIETSKEEEFEVLVASQGEEGVNIVKKYSESFDKVKVVFIDMRMPPGINGQETAKKIRELDNNIEIVIVTAYSDTSLKEVVDYVGRPDKLLYLKKPFDNQEIQQFALSLSKKYDSEVIKDRFLSSVTHELKTPLSSILGFNQLILGENLDEEIRSCSMNIHSSAKYLNSLIDDLIKCMAIEKSEIFKTKQSIDTKDLILDLYKNYKPLMNSDLELKIHCDNSIHVTSSIDGIRECINQLIQNAIKFTPSGEIILGNGQHEGKSFIYIQDTGIGMSEEVQKNIFSVFERAETDHHNIQGLGLGLHIVKKILDYSRVTIDVYSEIDVGTCFKLIFPEEQ